MYVKLRSRRNVFIMKLVRLFSVVVVAGLTLSCEKEQIVEDSNAVDLDLRKGGNSNKIEVCHTNAKVLSIDYHAAYEHLSHGDILFSCNPSDGVQLSDIQDDLEDIVKETGGDVNDEKDMIKAFEDWYINSYLTGEWESTDETPQGGGGGTGSGGIGGGSI